MQIASAHAVSSAPAAAFFARWADMATWPEWNLDTEWVRLDGPFAEGAAGQLKPKGGPTVPFVVERLTSDRFTDVSRLLGARLVFDHAIAERDGRTTVDVDVTLGGPLALLWKAILGGGIRRSAQPDLDRLVEVAEAA